MTTELATLGEDDALLVTLAREIAGDLRPLASVLATLGVSDEQFAAIKRMPRFSHLLEAHKAEWEAAGNTYERTKLKSAIMIEEWLPEAHRLLNSGKDTVNSKTELAKLIAKLAGMGLDRADLAGAAGDKVTININLGSDHKLKFDLPSRVIDAEAT